MASKQKVWTGRVGPCQFCHTSLEGKSFVDGATRMGPWAIMCLDCHKVEGHGIGQGRGQQYNAERVKVAG
jgi:hypothetical protein